MTTVEKSGPEQTPFVSSTFAVEFKGVAEGLFTELSGLSFDIEEVKSTRVIGGKSVTRFSPGTVKYGALTLKREFNGDKGFWQWHDDMCKGKAKYTDGSIFIHGIDGAIVDSWTVYKAWPSKWSVSDLDASGDDPMIEEIELQIEFIERAK